MSIRRPLLFSIRSTSSCTCAADRIRLVSSCRPRRATKTRLGSLIHTSSTVGSSSSGWSGPNPETRRDQLADHRVDVGDRRDRSGQAVVVMGTHHPFSQASYDERIALRVDALTAHGLADPLVE